MLELTIRLVFSLVVVLGLIAAIVKFGGRRFKAGSGAIVQIVHRQALSRTTSVAVVSVGSKVLVLGTTEQQVSVLAELDPEELDAGEIDLDNLTAMPGDSFPATLPAAAAIASPAAPEPVPAELVAAKLVAADPAELVQKVAEATPVPDDAAPRLAVPHPSRPQARPARRPGSPVVAPPAPTRSPLLPPAAIPAAAAVLPSVAQTMEPTYTSQPVESLTPAEALLAVEPVVEPVEPVQLVVEPVAERSALEVALELAANPMPLVGSSMPAPAVSLRPTLRGVDNPALYLVESDLVAIEGPVSTQTTSPVTSVPLAATDEDDPRLAALAALDAFSAKQREIAVQHLQPAAGPLAGSVLSPQTWRQAFAAVTHRPRKAS